MAQVAPGIIRVEMRYHDSTQNLLENVYYVKASGAVTTDLLDSLITAFEEWESPTAAGQRKVDLSLFEIVATDLTSLDGNRISHAVDPEAPGTHLGGDLPDNVTWAVKASIGKRGRGRNGRSYWLGLTDTMVSGNEIDGPSAAFIVAALNALKTAIAAVAGSDGLCVPHFVVNKARPATVLSDPVIEYVYTDFFLDSRKERLPFHNSYRDRKSPVG